MRITYKYEDNNFYRYLPIRIPNNINVFSNHIIKNVNSQKIIKDIMEINEHDIYNVQGNGLFICFKNDSIIK